MSKQTTQTETLEDEGTAMPNSEGEETARETEDVSIPEEQSGQESGNEPKEDGGEAVPPKDAQESPEQRIAVLEAELADAKDQNLRKAAEFENFRKRMTREKQEAIDFANKELLLDLIPVIDDFERALKMAEGLAANAGSSDAATQGGNADFRSFYEGIGLIEKRLSAQLENKWGLKRFDSAGEIFDPNKHEAIMMEKSPDVSEATVQEDFLKGYTLKDKLIRTPKVKVLMPESGDKNGAE
jgi:molecular chaperone GrpE